MSKRPAAWWERHLAVGRAGSEFICGISVDRHLSRAPPESRVTRPQARRTEPYWEKSARIGAISLQGIFWLCRNVVLLVEKHILCTENMHNPSPALPFESKIRLVGIWEVRGRGNRSCGDISGPSSRMSAYRQKLEGSNINGVLFCKVGPTDNNKTFVKVEIRSHLRELLIYDP